MSRGYQTNGSRSTLQDASSCLQSLMCGASGCDPKIDCGDLDGERWNCRRIGNRSRAEPFSFGLVEGGKDNNECGLCTLRCSTLSTRIGMEAHQCRLYMFQELARV
ncbi:hypothetical protein BD310DRAFT_671837 [Dichomitus squalens]|uniref:Uncharacterized protein n=1 Tax=Dichomitus squalens TaxID=114155 RepID=A0A4Q9PN43_9APHY|nr:hypothetical protein BD310DRAFT_671837 [Dichomitus squalens]